MTIRSKLNVLFTAVLAVFLTTVGFVVYAYRLDVAYTDEYSRMRGLGQFVSDVRTSLYLHLAADGGVIPQPEGFDRAEWPQYALEDIEVQIRLAENDQERTIWSQVYEAVDRIGRMRPGVDPPQQIDDALRSAEHKLLDIRNDFSLRQYRLMADISRTHLSSQVAVWVSATLTIMLFVIYLVMVRHWLVEPIAVLKRWADRIGSGAIDMPAPLKGTDELAGLAEHMVAMTDSLKRHQAALLEAHELSAIGEVCSNVAHGLRNPLASMRSSAELAELHAANSEPMARMMRDLIRQADRMDKRISMMFEYSRPSRRSPSVTTFGELAASARAETQPLVDLKRIRPRIEDATGDTAWSLDRERMAGVLAELLTNAAHHSPEGSEVLLRGAVVERQDGAGRELVIKVVDHGAGMSAAVQKKAFDMFYTSRPDGTGMGLCLARRVVEQHGGTIAVESEPGRGTTMIVTIPARVSVSPPQPGTLAAAS